MKAHPVAYAMKEKIEKELDRLISLGILEPIQFSEWASPIVPVLKSDGSVRICGDPKVTLNSVSKLDCHRFRESRVSLPHLVEASCFLSWT